MSRKRYTPEQIIGMLRQAEVELAQGRKVPEVCRKLGVSDQSHYRWRNESGFPRWSPLSGENLPRFRYERNRRSHGVASNGNRHRGRCPISK